MVHAIHPHSLLLWSLSISSLCSFSYANVEKTIFLGPKSTSITKSRPNLDDLNLRILSPEHNSYRSHLDRVFPSESQPQGEQSWYILDGLQHDRRYELRICWAATQPTEFWIHAHSLSDVFETPSLISSLAKYSESRRHHLPIERDPSFINPSWTFSDKSYVLFLQIHSAADYYTTNRTLMLLPPPVYADIILDPYLLNVLPRSLLPTGVYLIFATCLSWFISKAIWKWLRDMAINKEKPHKVHEE